MNTVQPDVHLIAHTQLTPEAEQWMEIQSPNDAETLTEFAGRACYQSFHRPNPKTATTEKYLNRTLFEQKHWSIAEHATATFYITGVSRAFTHELIRHRHLSFSQLSQRFVNGSNTGFVIPPALRDAVAKNGDELEPILYQTWENNIVAYMELNDALDQKGLPRKQAREAARAVLPNMAETRIVVTGNLRAWREVIDRRTAPDADAEMQEVMTMVEQKLHTIAPTVFP